jgi:rhodanese-related sulfurtransferase
MIRSTFSKLVLTFSVVAVSSMVSCKKDAATDRSAADVKQSAVAFASITVDDLETMVASKAGLAVDANSQDTRKRMGIVPGALLLTDAQNFQVSELPSDKQQTLVFYCGGERCKASHQAAERALAAGYSNVKVMSAGIAGWVSAGKQVTAI